jgi:hypothetical protein
MSGLLMVIHLKDINEPILKLFESPIAARILCILGFFLYSWLVLPDFIGLVFGNKEFSKSLFLMNREEFSTLKSFVPFFWIFYSTFFLPAYLVCIYGSIKPVYLEGRLRLGWHLLFFIGSCVPTAFVVGLIVLFTYGA